MGGRRRVVMIRCGGSGWWRWIWFGWLAGDDRTYGVLSALHCMVEHGGS